MHHWCPPFFFFFFARAQSEHLTYLTGAVMWAWSWCSGCASNACTCVAGPPPCASGKCCWNWASSCPVTPFFCHLLTWFMLAKNICHVIIAFRIIAKRFCLVSPVDQRVVFSDANTYYQFSFEECDSTSCEFRANEGDWPEAVRLLLQLAPYVQFRSADRTDSP